MLKNMIFQKVTEFWKTSLENSKSKLEYKAWQQKAQSVIYNLKLYVLKSIHESKLMTKFF